MIILGIESSCDETAAAVVDSGRRILSSVVSSQIAVHRPYGGVVPELASRKHIEAIVPVVKQALSDADIDKRRLDAVALTQGPGLVGALLVGFSFGRAYAYALGIPWIGVDHLKGHVNAVFLEPDPPPFPFVSLLVSGGHSSLYHVLSHTRMELMGQTRDDAAGEAYDKVAKMLGLGYPGGIAIDRLAKEGTPGVVRFPRPYLDKSAYDFSFSGLKSAVRRYIEQNPKQYRQQTADIAAEFQEAVVDVLCFKVIQAAKTRKCSRLSVVGGVAANSRLRHRIRREAARQGLSPYIPSIGLCGDNAAMIAAVGYHYLKKGRCSRLDEDVYSKKKLKTN